jgi:hypothetical protein
MSEKDDLPLTEETEHPDPALVDAADMIEEGSPVDPATPMELDPSTEVAADLDAEEDAAAPDEDHLNSFDDMADGDDALPSRYAPPPHEASYDDLADDEPYDVDAALAAIGTLNTIADPIDVPAALPDYETPQIHSTFRQPSLSTLERGQAASVVPALLLIGVGVFLTFLLTSGTPLPSTNVLLGLLLVCVGISLLAAWISSGRWARGNLAMGIGALLFGALLFVV